MATPTTYARFLRTREKAGSPRAARQFHSRTGSKRRRSASMGLLARRLRSNDYQVANGLYGGSAGRLGQRLAWEFDTRKNGSAILIYAVAEGWKRPGKSFEWVMVPRLAAALLSSA